MSTKTQSEGFVTGLLERINVHNRREFVLYPLVGGFRVVCEFPDSLFDQVKAGLKRNVTVSGTMQFHPEKAFPERVRVRQIEILPHDSDLPTLAALRGSLRRATGDLTSVEFIRAIRNDGDSQD